MTLREWYDHETIDQEEEDRRTALARFYRREGIVLRVFSWKFWALTVVIGVLRGAYLRGAYLRGAYLRGANLEGLNKEEGA